MNIKLTRSAYLANKLLNRLKESNRDYSNINICMFVINIEEGYCLSSKERIMFVTGHWNYDKYRLHFIKSSYNADDIFKFYTSKQIKRAIIIYETYDINEVEELIIDYMFHGENDKLDKILK